jgi:hypothetical protein
MHDPGEQGDFDELEEGEIRDSDEENVGVNANQGRNDASTRTFSFNWYTPTFSSTAVTVDDGRWVKNRLASTEENGQEVTQVLIFRSSCK